MNCPAATLGLQLVRTYIAHARCMYFFVIKISKCTSPGYHVHFSYTSQVARCGAIFLVSFDVQFQIQNWNIFGRSVCFIRLFIPFLSSLLSLYFLCLLRFRLSFLCYFLFVFLFSIPYYTFYHSSSLHIFFLSAFLISFLSSFIYFSRISYVLSYFFLPFFLIYCFLFSPHFRLPIFLVFQSAPVDATPLHLSQAKLV